MSAIFSYAYAFKNGGVNFEGWSAGGNINKTDMFESLEFGHLTVSLS